MSTQQTGDVWTLRSVCFCLIATLFVTAVVFALGGVAGMLVMGRESFQTFRLSVAARSLYYIGSRVLALAVCIYFAKVRTRQDFASGFALRPATSRFLILAGMLGIWIVFFVKVIEPDGLAHVQFHTYFSIASLTLLGGPFFEEAVMRGFFYPAFRNSLPLVVSILFVFAIDTLLLHYRTFRIPQALLGVGIVNVVSCLFRERTSSLWPSITFHLAYNVPFAILVWMR